MKVWTNNQFKGLWPVGTAAVVVAANPIRAATLLNEALVEMGLEPTARVDDMKPVKTSKECVIILCNGDY